MLCAGVAFVVPQCACGQSNGAQASEAVSSDVVKEHTPAAERKDMRERHISKMPTTSHNKKVAVDIKTLEARLKHTDAIGFFTKLAIRSNIIDLMNKIKQYRKKSMLKAKIKEIRTSFDGLILKIVALLEEDPKLSRDLYVGRESIWKSLLEVKA